MRISVSGVYRHDNIGHTEQGLKEYSIEVSLPVFHRGQAIKAAELQMRKIDPSFDSFKTHHIQELMELEPETPPESETPPEPETPLLSDGQIEEIFE